MAYYNTDELKRIMAETLFEMNDDPAIRDYTGARAFVCAMDRLTQKLEDLEVENNDKH